MSKAILNITGVQFNHAFISDVKRLLAEGYVDLPKNHAKHALKDQRSETILDVLAREYAEKYLNEDSVFTRERLKLTLANMLQNKAKLQLMAEDGTLTGETPLNKLKTRNLSAGTSRADVNDIWMSDLFASNEEEAENIEEEEETEEVSID